MRLLLSYLAVWHARRSRRLLDRSGVLLDRAEWHDLRCEYLLQKVRAR